MSPDRDPGQRDDEPEMDEYDAERSRSIFAALWFRALLAVLVLGVLAAVVVPYVLDFATHPTTETTAAKRPVTAPPSAVTPPTARPAPKASAPADAPPATPAPAPPPAVAAPAPPAPITGPALPPATAKPTATAAPVVTAKNTAKVVEAPKETPKAVAASKPTAAKATSAASAGGAYWVQVGAFKDPAVAKRLVAHLREQGFRAEQSTTSKGGGAPAPEESPGDRYHVFVSGASTGDVDAKLAAKGLTSETTTGGVIVQPSLALRDAVALSRDLADAGLAVQVRRVSGPATSAPAATAVTWHRVRVGGFSDRAAAVASLKQLEEKGFKPFIATGNE